MAGFFRREPRTKKRQRVPLGYQVHRDEKGILVGISAAV